ncbi:MAG: peptide chain release factor N(5)-glutamine methyltransferase [Chthoniobacterales bacterium]|nr:peptide chain release factor N(5)-glutamine methyltransferase [Chthoniobacterales bacterium]
MTVLEVLQSTTAYFKKREIESPRLNAEHLLAHSLGVKRIDLYLEFERQLTEAELAPLRDVVRRRGQSEPLQHLLGTVEFCGRLFICDKRALIPRPETEELAEMLIVECAMRNADLRVVDVGTGSGVLALTLAAQFPEAEVHAIDISDEALALARENAAQLKLSERVRFARSNLLEQVDGSFDVIVANLPYVASTERATLSREVLRDPEAALFGGPNGDELIRALIVPAPGHLRPGGVLALEIGIGQAEGLSAFLAEQGYKNISSRHDFARVTRFLFATYG